MSWLFEFNDINYTKGVDIVLSTDWTLSPLGVWWVMLRGFFYHQYELIKKSINHVVSDDDIRYFTYACIKYSGIPFIFREIVQRNKVTILLFHDIRPEAAETVFKFLLKKYTIISLDEFFDLYRKKKKFPRKALVITFDDGRGGNYGLLPILKKYGVPITIFVCSGIVNSNRHFWFSKKHPLYGFEQLIDVPNRKKLQILKEIGFEQEKNYSGPQALSKEQIIEMLPFVNFQSHTMFHSCLTKCDDDEAYEEIFNSKYVLEKEYNLNINAIAYPNGDYSERDIQLCIDVGYEFGLTVDYGFNTCETDPFRLKRISVNDTDNINELITKSSGVWGIVRYIFLELRQSLFPPRHI